MSRNATLIVRFEGTFVNPAHAQKEYRVDVPADCRSDRAKLAWAKALVGAKAYVRKVASFELVLDETTPAPAREAKPRKQPVKASKAPSAPDFAAIAAASGIDEGILRDAYASAKRQDAAFVVPKPNTGITQTRAERKASKARKVASDRKDPRLAIHEQRMQVPAYAKAYESERKVGTGHVTAIMRAYRAMEAAVVEAPKAKTRKTRKAA